MRAHASVALICLLILLCAFVPAAASAGVLSDILSALLPTASAQSNSSSTTDNIQTMQLPQPATNIDPSGTSTDPTVTVVGDSALAPQDGPDGTTVVTEGGPGGQITNYTVQPGDTLSSIAAAYNVSVNTILWANNLTKNSIIKPGDTLVILPINELLYTVQKGDTLESIAKRFGSDAGDIAGYNEVDDSSLQVGQTIVIPGGELNAPATSSSSGSSSGSGSGSGNKKSSTPKKGSVSDKIIQTASAGCGDIIPLANNPAEPAHDVGPAGTCSQIAYYTAPLAHYIQTQDIHGYNAVDLAAPMGTPIMAAAAGTVIVAKEGGWNGGYGSYVVISHNNGTQTLYAHMSEVDAQVGEVVAQGQVIGKVGMTGDATGPHVHFEIRGGIRNPF